MEKTTKALLLIAKLGSKVSEDLADDNRIDAMEWIGLGGTALGFIGVIKNLKKIKEELKEFNEEKKAALFVAFKNEFDLPDDALEAKIETGIEFILNLYLYIHGEGPENTAEIVALKSAILPLKKAA